MAPAACPDRAAVLAKVARWLGSAQKASPGLEVRASVQEEASPGGTTYLLSLTLLTPTSQDQQVLRALSCEALGSLVALQVALLIDPLAVVAEPPPEPPEPSAPVAPSVPLRPEVRLEPQSAAQRVPFELGLNVAALAWWGLGDDTVWGLSAAAFFQRRAFRAELGAARAFPHTVRYEVPNSAGARIVLHSGHARLCAVPSLGRVQLAMCGGLEAGAMRADGFGLSSARRSSLPWLAATVVSRVLVPVTRRLWLGLQVEGLGQLHGVSFRARGLPELHASPAASLRIALGAEVRFP